MSARRPLLIVEDDHDLRRLYRRALTMEGFDVREARSGFEALRILDGLTPALVVLDLGLAGIDGVAVRHELAAQVATRHIPIVVVTGSSANLDFLDVACVLRKPVDGDELVKAVRRCLPVAEE